MLFMFLMQMFDFSILLILSMYVLKFLWSQITLYICCIWIVDYCKIMAIYYWHFKNPTIYISSVLQNPGKSGFKNSTRIFPAFTKSWQKVTENPTKTFSAFSKLLGKGFWKSRWNIPGVSQTLAKGSPEIEFWSPE